MHREHAQGISFGLIIYCDSDDRFMVKKCF